MRVAAAYVVTSWLLIQVAETIFPLFGFGDAPARVVVIVVGVAFVPMLIISWVFELTPEGFRRDGEVDHASATENAATQRFDRIVIVVLALGLVYFAFDKFILSQSREQLIVEQAREAAFSEVEKILDQNKSIAVLPFVDLSEDGDQAYFADGIAEELLNVLAQLEGLNVASRSSSFQFRGPELDLTDVGNQLGVAHILEGSVRKQDDKVRITAQLIETASGFHLWSDNYEDQLHDVFAVQDRIARDVAGALSIALDVDGRNVLPGAGTDSIEAYEAFLEANALLQTTRDHDLIASLYEKAIALDPEYAAAWASRALMYGINSYRLPAEQARESQEKGREYALKAIEIDPDYARSYAMVSGFEWTRANWVGAHEWHDKYIEKAPADVLARLGPANVYARVGRVNEALEIIELQDRYVPENFLGLTIKIERLIQVGRLDEAREALATADAMVPPPEQATDLRRLLLALSGDDLDNVRLALEAYAAADRRARPVLERILAVFDSPPRELLVQLRNIYENDLAMSGEGKLAVAGLAAFLDAPEFALEVMSKELEVNMVRTSRLWYPFFSDMRQLPAFNELVTRIGFVDYWRTYGWPEYCEPDEDDTFRCS